MQFLISFRSGETQNACTWEYAFHILAKAWQNTPIMHIEIGVSTEYNLGGAKHNVLVHGNMRNLQYNVGRAKYTESVHRNVCFIKAYLW